VHEEKEEEMKIDRTTKLLLLLVAVGLWINVLVSLFRSPATVKASESVHCKGTLTANAWGGTEATIGGYDVDLNCR
jgi:hypothetical protein